MKKLISITMGIGALIAAVGGQALAGDLKIVGFEAGRSSGGRVFVHGAVKNTSTNPMGSVPYSFWLWDGKLWQPLKGDKRVTKASDPIKSLGAGDSIGVWLWLANVGDGEQRYQLEAVLPSGVKVSQEFTLPANPAATPKPPVKDKKPILTVISLKCIFSADDDGDGIDTRFFDERAEKPWFGGGTTRVLMKRGQLKRFSEYAASKFGGDDRHVMSRPVVVELWKVNRGVLQKDDKLGASRILTSESGEQTITFSGKVDGRIFKYEVKYRVDQPK